MNLKLTKHVTKNYQENSNKKFCQNHIKQKEFNYSFDQIPYLETLEKPQSHDLSALSSLIFLTNLSGGLTIKFKEFSKTVHA